MLVAVSAASIFAATNINSHPLSSVILRTSVRVCSPVYTWLEFSSPSVVMTKIVCSGTSSSLAYLCTFAIWCAAEPIASSNAVPPPTRKSPTVISLTLSIGTLSWTTTLSVLKSTVETSTSPSSSRCFASIALNPPTVSFSIPDIEPLLSIINTSTRYLQKSWPLHIL